MANIGDILLQPESGWKRIDSNDNLITFIGDDWILNDTRYPVFYNGTISHKQICTDSDEIRFSFVGTKLRFFSSMSNSRGIQTIQIDDGDVVEFNTNGSGPNGTYLLYEQTGLDKKIHVVSVKLKTGNWLSIDCIDIDEDGYLVPELSRNYEFPVKIGNEEDVMAYSESLIGGEEQLLITRDGNIYLTKGDGTYIPVGSNGSSADVPNKDSHSHKNKEIIDKFNETNGNLLYDGKIIGNGNQDGSADIEINALKTDVKNIKKVIENYDIDEDGIIDNAKNIKGIEDAHYLTYYGRDINGNIGFHSFPVVTYEQGSINQAVKLNVTPSSSYAIDLANTNPNGDFIIQCFKFISGEKNVSQTLKEFNNGDNLNFFYDNENVNFNGTINIKDEHNIGSSVINTNSFVEIYEIMEEQYE